jgi:hypothetical protein
MANGCDLVYNGLDILLAKGHATTSYVIMPNYLHLLLHYSGGTQSLNTIVGNGKWFMSYDIVKKLEQQNQWILLNRLQLAVETSDRESPELYLHISALF